MKGTELVKYCPDFMEQQSKSIMERVKDAVRHENDMRYWFERIKQSFDSRPKSKTWVIK